MVPKVAFEETTTFWNNVLWTDETLKKLRHLAIMHSAIFGKELTQQISINTLCLLSSTAVEE